MTAGGMLDYHSPSIAIALVARHTATGWLYAPAAVFFLAATLAIPGFMSHYCRAFEASEIYNPLQALHRGIEGGAAYWHAWAILLAALAASFLGLLVFGVGFLVTSVWFWQVAGFRLAADFTKKFDLARPPAG